MVIYMKYLGMLSKIKIFNYNTLVKIVGNNNLANATIQNYLKKGFVKRVKRDLYTTISLETDGPLADKFLIGSNITKSSFISHHSAFEFYGYYNQVYNTVTVSSLTPFNSLEFEKNAFVPIHTKSSSFVEIIRGVRVASIERTIVDSIKDSGKYSDLEETLNCIKMIPYISIDDIAKYLEEISSKMLYKKVGLILSLFKEQFNIPESFFQKCHDMSDSVKGYFDNNKKAHVYNKEWKIFVYKDLSSYIN